MNRALLFGGTFDPIHHGHLIVSRFVAEQLQVARVVLIPSANPPHKRGQPLAPSADRLAMCRLATAGDTQFEVSDWETQQPGPNFTLYTIQHFAEVLGPATQLYWLIGMDSLNELATWHRAGELVDACQIVTAGRPGSAAATAAALLASFSSAQIDALLAHVLDSPHVDIAGTDIRARVQRGQSIRYLVPEAVRGYIAERGLYRLA